MTKTAMISAKVDKQLKEDAQEVLGAMGLTLSSYITASLKKAVMERRVEFVASERMTPKLERSLAAIEKDIRAGKNLVGPFLTVEEFRRALES